MAQHERHLRQSDGNSFLTDDYSHSLDEPFFGRHVECGRDVPMRLTTNTGFSLPRGELCVKGTRIRAYHCPWKLTERICFRCDSYAQRGYPPKAGSRIHRSARAHRPTHLVVSTSLPVGRLVATLLAEALHTMIQRDDTRGEIVAGETTPEYRRLDGPSVRAGQILSAECSLR